MVFKLFNTLGMKPPHKKVLRSLSGIIIDDLSKIDDKDACIYPGVGPKLISVAELINDIKSLTPVGLGFMCFWLESTSSFLREFDIKPYRDHYFLAGSHPLLNDEYLDASRKLDHIAYEIGGKLERNPTFDERGLTDELLDMLRIKLGTKLGKGQYINFHINKPSEKKTGADILLRIKVRQKELAFDRYVLIQAKKYLGKEQKFSETNPGNPHLESQLAKMHKYNPEFSYLMFYAPLSIPFGSLVLGSRFSDHLRLFEKAEEYESRSFKDEIARRTVYLYPITILRARTWENFNDTSPGNLLAYSEILSSFFLNDLITGKIGKDWDTEINDARGEFSIYLTFSMGIG